MPELFDWQRGDPRLAIQRAVQELVAGNHVVFPTECGYHIAASGLHPEALAALSQAGNGDEAVLAVRGVADAVRWAPWMSLTARRLARRCWPGPVTLVIENEAPSAAPEISCAQAAGTIRLRAPAHDAALLALEQLSGPLVLAPVSESTLAEEQLIATLGEAVTVVITDDLTAAKLTPTVVHIQGEDWTVTRTGAVTAEMLQGLMPTTIVFVCTGNTCRSPLAQALCKKLLAERLGCDPAELPKHGFLVLSAGLAAMMGAEASPEAVEVAEEYGADLSGHRSQPLTADLLARADYLFAMTAGHLRALLPYVPEDGPQPRLLAPDGSDVSDPLGSNKEVYRHCAQQILGHLQACLHDLRPL